MERLTISEVCWPKNRRPRVRAQLFQRPRATPTKKAADVIGRSVATCEAVDATVGAVEEKSL